MTLLDSNIFMYAAGAAHRNKAASRGLLARVARDEVEAFTDVEVLQEILHRYRAIRRWKRGRSVYDLTRKIVSTIVPITVDIMDEARLLLDCHSQLSARDALHAAVCILVGDGTICSYDADFDGIAGLKRVEPHEL